MWSATPAYSHNIAPANVLNTIVTTHITVYTESRKNNLISHYSATETLMILRTREIKIYIVENLLKQLHVSYILEEFFSHNTSSGVQRDFHFTDFLINLLHELREI